MERAEIEATELAWPTTRHRVLRLTVSEVVAAYTIEKSKAKDGCRDCPERGDEFDSGESCKKLRKCDRRLKDRMDCPNGREGFFKIKGQRKACE